MIIEILIALLLGVSAGTFTGLAPGIHINLVAALLLASLDKIPLSSIALAVFITAMSITHTFLDFIPSIFLGAPEEDTFLSVLPGHELLKQGKGYEAVVLTLYGSLSALAIILIISPFFIKFIPFIFTATKSTMPFLLIFISFYIIFRDDSLVPALIVFLLAGLLGITAFQLPINQSLLPLLTGLFGLSSLIISIKHKPLLEAQQIPRLKNIKLPRKDLLKAFFSAAFIAPFFSFLPGIGSGHAATIASELFPQERRGFLFLTGAINTIVMSLSFVTVYAIGKTRTGSAVAVKELLHTITSKNLILIIITIIAAGIISFFLGIAIARLFAQHFSKVNYQKLTLAVIVFLIIINLIFSGWLGLLVLATSSALGIYCISSGARRINLMACLILPSIVYYLAN